MIVQVKGMIDDLGGGGILLSVILGLLPGGSVSGRFKRRSRTLTIDGARHR
jgi:hypothetical protein